MTIIKQVTTKERCDSCPAKAHYRVTLSTGKLYFCRHHYNKNEEALNNA